MIYLQLLFVFLKVGLFGFGGGYAMIPLIERELSSYGWIASREFADIIAISQMTPGPLAINAATFVGFRIAGLLGSMVATVGVSFPSFFIVLLVARFMVQFKESPGVQGILEGIRPATVGLIAAAVGFFARISFLYLGGLATWPEVFEVFGHSFRLEAVGIFLVIFIGVKWFGLKPIPAVFFSAGLGVLLL